MGSTRLVIEKGHREGEIIPLGLKSKMTLGRDAKCDVQIFDNGLSRQHAIIEMRGDSFVICDMSSTNGTYVNGNLILTKELNNKDLIRVGKTELRFVLGMVDSKNPSVKIVEPTQTEKPMISKRMTSENLNFLTWQDNETENFPKPENEEKTGALNLLYEIGNLINAEKDLHKLCNTIMDIIMTKLKAYRGFLLLLNKDEKTFEPAVVRRGRNDDPNKDLTLSSTIVKESIEHGKSILTTDAGSDDRFNKGVSVKLNDIQAVMCVPVESQQKILGAIYIDSRGFKNSFTEIGLQLLTAIGKQAGIAIERTQLIKHYVEKEKLKHSLLVAQDIQRSLLPREVPKVKGFDIIGVSLSCDETGGDYYDFIYFDEKQFSVIVGDVAGHGVGAALMMATVRAYMRCSMKRTSNLTEVLNTMNDLLEYDMDGNQFVTLIACKLDPETKRLTYSSAGHDEPIFYRVKDNTFQTLTSTGMPLGIFPQEYPEGEPLQFSTGDILLLSTDGVWEAINNKEEVFGKERLKEILIQNKHKSANQIINTIYEQVKKFIEPRSFEDDFTLVIIKAE